MSKEGNLMQSAAEAGKMFPEKSYASRNVREGKQAPRGISPAKNGIWHPCTEGPHWTI